MTRSFAGWMFFAVVGCGALPVAQAAEQGGQPAKQQAVSTTTPMSAPASHQASTLSASPASNQASSAQSAASPLEGTSWPVKVIPDAMAAEKGEKPFDDALIFKDGKVTMSACVKMGFAASAYSLTQTGETWSFSTRQLSQEQGTTRWSAMFTGDAVKGALVWVKKDSTILHYTFEGKKATTPGAS